MRTRRVDAWLAGNRNGLWLGLMVGAVAGHALTLVFFWLGAR
jgi:hypothetical protein